MPKPDESTAWTPRKVLQWGDYFRGIGLPESSHPNSRYVKAEKAAIRIIQRGISEKNYVAVQRFMLGVKASLEDDLEFRDEWWADNQKADVWNVEEHFDAMAKKIKDRKRTDSGLRVVGAPDEKPQSVLLSEDKNQRNIDRLKARIAEQQAQQAAKVAVVL